MPRRLSTRLVWITMISILLAQFVIFVPSIGNFRNEWLGHKIEAVAVASFASGQGNGIEGPMLSPEREAELLRSLDAQLIAVQAGGAPRLLARLPEVSTIGREIVLDEETALGTVFSAMKSMLGDGREVIRVMGPIGDGSMRAEVVMEVGALRDDLRDFAREFILIALIVAIFAGLFLNIALDRLLVGPIRQMTASMIRFGEKPEDPERIIVPSPREDELGLAGRELQRMQTTLARTLRERRHLADLGLAVSKINHDLRNTLASAQLVSDRLSDIPDPDVQRFLPTLIRSLDRAIGYTRSVLAYGRAAEARPVRRKLRLFALVDEILDNARAESGSDLEFVNAVPEDLVMEVDPEQFHRALANLVRNSREALELDATQGLVRRITVGASADEGATLVYVEDTGPGLSAQAKESLFQAFRGSTRSGGTGLGLVIAAEIVEAHGGHIRHSDWTAPGARFEIELPRAGDGERRRTESRRAAPSGARGRADLAPAGDPQPSPDR